MLRTVHTKNGTIEGLSAADPRITSFKGIPFAKPPVGNLRFHAPVKAEPWDGVLKAYKFSPVPVQVKPYHDPEFLYCREWSVDKDIPMSEDCLYLNVWTPAKSEDEKLPVYVWIYGGAFQTGYTAEMEFDGERIARRGIVVVTVNYRLNMFGFMCHPEITKENPSAPANFGLLDQRMALEWVHENIEAFGGDSSNVTIGGQSAGGASVMNQIIHGTDGLFSRAVVHSGMFMMEKDNISDPIDFSVAEKNGQDFFAFAGVKNLEEIRKMTLEELWQKWEQYGGFEKSFKTWIPVNDGCFLNASLNDALKANKIKNIPLLLGYTPDEFKYMPQGCTREKDMVNAIERAVKTYQELVMINRTDVKNYAYCFNVEIPGFDKPGIFHSSDLWFWFETLAKCWRPFVGKHYDTARKMCNYLCNFIKNGNPNGTDCDGTAMSEWKPYNGTEETLMVLK